MVIIQGNRLGMLLAIPGLIIGCLIFQFLPGPYNIRVALAFLGPGLVWLLLDRRIRRQTGDYKTEAGGAWLGMPVWQYGLIMSVIGLIFGIICPRNSNAELREYWKQVGALSAKRPQENPTAAMNRIEAQAKQQGQAVGETLLADSMTESLRVTQSRLADCQRIQPPATYANLHREQTAYYQQDALLLNNVIQALRAHDANSVNVAFEALQAHEKEGETLRQKLVQEAEKVQKED